MKIGRIKVVKYCETYPLDSQVVCPHCGKHVSYRDIHIQDGVYCCNGCQSSLTKLLEDDREFHTNLHRMKIKFHEYEPFRYKGEELCKNG